MNKRTLLLTAFLVTGLLSRAFEVREHYDHYSEWLVESEMQRVAHPYNLDFSPSKTRWAYSLGIELECMFDTYLAYGNEAVGDYVREYPEKMVKSDGSIERYKYSDFNLDNVRPGHFLFKYYQAYPADKELTALATLFRQLRNQPRTEEGVWWHKEVYKQQVWLDGIFMGLPYYVLAAPVLDPDNVTTYYDDAVDQIKKTEQHTYDEATGLWKHAWDETHSIFWADPETGLSQHTWGRALGWFSMAMLEVLETLPADYDRRQELLPLFQKVMAAVVRYQDAASGVWYDVLDVTDPDNYLEATASSMFTYCMLKGARLGLLDESYLQKGIDAYRSLVREFVQENGDGTLSLTRCCEVSGLGPESNPRRDGSFKYYMSEKIRDNDAKGIGPFVWASLEMEQMGYTVDNLFDTPDPVQPEEPVADARVWDFTHWSAATVSNLKADAGWSDIEKASASAPTDLSRDNCFWQVEKGEQTLTANGTAIAELDGLRFTNTVNRALAIAVNYQNVIDDFSYHGPSYLWLGSRNINYFLIPDVQPGDTVTLGVESHKNESRGVQLYAGEDNSGALLLSPTGEAVPEVTAYRELRWLMPLDATTTSVTVRNTNGCHLYFVRVSPKKTDTTTAVASVRRSSEPSATYTLTGRKVAGALPPGVYVRNGRKWVVNKSRH